MTVTMKNPVPMTASNAISALFNSTRRIRRGRRSEDTLASRGAGLVAVALMVAGIPAPRAVPRDLGIVPVAPAGAGVGRTVAQHPLPRHLLAGNLLVNPGFEDGFRAVGAPELVVAEGWQPWFDDAGVRPEFKDEPHARFDATGRPLGFSIRVFHGADLQKFFTTSATHDAGFFQVAEAPPGATVRFSIWARTWSSDCDDPCTSPRGPCREGSPNSHGTYRVSVGLDEAGRTPSRLGAPTPDTVKWSAPVVFEAYDGWVQLEAEGEVADTGAVAVYVRGAPLWPVKHNDSYWDDARLEVVPVPGELPFRVLLPALTRPGAGLAARGAAADGWQPVPPGADIRIEYPIRAFPAQENFSLPTCDDLDFESVLIANRGLVTVTMGAWTLADADGNSFEFPALGLAPGDRVRLWTRPGPDTTDGTFTDLYWGRGEPVWDGPRTRRPWDEALLRDSAGVEVARRGYP